MKRTRQQSIFLSIAILVSLVAISMMASLFYQIPTLQISQQQLESSRISLAVLERQAASSADVDEQIATLEQTQADLDQHLWKFSEEESFFTRWDSFGQANGIVVEIDQVADVVPSDQPIVRTASLILTGSLSNILTAVSRLQSTDPLLSIRQLTLQPDTETSGIRAQITLESVWQ